MLIEKHGLTGFFVVVYWRPWPPAPHRTPSHTGPAGPVEFECAAGLARNARKRDPLLARAAGVAREPATLAG